jgi:hypothetical protein
MSNRYSEGPESQLSWWYARQRPRMAGVDEPEGTERDHQEAGAYPDLPLPFDERGQEREGQQHHQHRQQVTDGERPKRRNEGARTPFHQAG